MEEIEEIKEVLRVHKNRLKEGFEVKKIGIFGSLVRGEHEAGSDIDILVVFEKPIGFFVTV